MAMTLLNNSAANLTLGQLNRNITKVGKQLAKVSSGQKIVYAGDDSASFGISETMRAKIRALEQDIQNVQNGSSMLKVALGGIDNIVEELRSLRELAINSANDSNSDEDRQILQNDFDKKRDTIDDIASWTNYNTKTLLDGTYSRSHYKETVTVEYGEPETRTIEAGTKIVRVVLEDGRTVMETQTVNAVEGIASRFDPINASVTFADGSMAVPTKTTTLYSSRPKDMKKGYTSGYIQPNYNFNKMYSTHSAPPMAVKIDFTGMKSSNGYIFQNGVATGSRISELHDQGFSILCGDCSQYVNIKFSTETTETTCTFSGSGDNPVTASLGRDIEYVIGIQGLTEGTTSHKDFVNFMTDSLYNCMDRRRNPYDLSSSSNDRTNGRLTDNKDNFAIAQAHNLQLARDDKGNCYFTKVHNNSLAILDEGVVSNKSVPVTYPPITEDREVPYTIDIQVIPVYELSKYDWMEGKPLWIQHGTKANQHTNVFINDMHCEALDITCTDITTKEKATASLDWIDNAISYALDEATNVGAYLQRFEYTEANVTTEAENTQAADSTFRDADMAKEMTEYTKYNVLSQAAQSMLAQANQNMSGVLSLLQ